tara:strand:- start:2424 stop:2804 length:381 start_codon:yes stop_codon:yes gene_type:complete
LLRCRSVALSNPPFPPFQIGKATGGTRTVTATPAVAAGAGDKVFPGIVVGVRYHIALIVKNGAMRIFQNGLQVGLKGDGHEPNTVARAQLIVGGAWDSISQSVVAPFDGTTLKICLIVAPRPPPSP